MKKVSVLAGAVLALGALLLSGCSWVLPDSGFGDYPEAARVSQAPVEELRRKYTGYGFQALTSDKERQLYAAIDEAVQQPHSTEFYSEPFDNMQRVSDILELYKDDFPGVFWIDEAEPYYYATRGDVLQLSLHFKLEDEALQAARDELEQAVQGVLANAPEGSDYDRELYVHDYLIENCVYDDEAVELHKSDKVRANEQNAYGALVEQRAVCEGYTRAFQLLCERLNVTCWVIQGQAKDFGDEGNVNHIWNCVQLDGDWYHVDVTWDDYEDAAASTDCYYYFNLTTAEIEKDHTISPLFNENEQEDVWYNGFVPDCTATTYNYFVLNAMPITDLDSGDYALFVAQAAGFGQASCCFTVSEALNFQDTFDALVSGYAYDWVSGANEINEYEPYISNGSKLSANETRRVITLLLDYA